MLYISASKCIYIYSRICIYVYIYIYIYLLYRHNFTLKNHHHQPRPSRELKEDGWNGLLSDFAVSYDVHPIVPLVYYYSTRRLSHRPISQQYWVSGEEDAVKSPSLMDDSPTATSSTVVSAGVLLHARWIIHTRSSI